MQCSSTAVTVTEAEAFESDPERVMIVRCMWCDEVIGSKDNGGNGVKLSHGCCDPCLRKHYPEEAEAVIASMNARNVKN